MASRFLVDVPELWENLDLSGGQLARTRARALAAAGGPAAQARVNDMFRQGREIARAARRQGALLATGTATLYDDGLFLAYGMVFAVTTPEGSELTLPVLSAQLGAGNGAGPPDRKITSVRLPQVGTAARVTGTETTRLTGDVDVRLLTMHTMVPVPRTTEDFLVLTLASPNLPLKTEVYDLFDAISSTFRFVGG